MAKFNIINKAEKVIDYTFIITDKCPRKTRIDVVPEMRKIALAIIENIVTANHYRPSENTTFENLRFQFQDNALIEIEKLDVISEVCMKRNYITQKQYEFLTKLTYELKDMIINWRNNIGVK